MKITILETFRETDQETDIMKTIAKQIMEKIKINGPIDTYMEAVYLSNKYTHDFDDTKHIATFEDGSRIRFFPGNCEVKLIKNEPLLTTVQVAMLLGKDRHTILNHIKSGKLPALKLSRDYLIKRTDLKLIVGLKRGRPAAA